MRTTRRALYDAVEASDIGSDELVDVIAMEDGRVKIVRASSPPQPEEEEGEDFSV